MPPPPLITIVNRTACEKTRKGQYGIRWGNVLEKICKDLRGDQEEIVSIEKLGGYKAEVKETVKERERQTLRNKLREKHLEIYGGLREGIAKKMYLHGPMDYAKKLKLRFHVGDLDLPERGKRYTSSREGEDVDTNMCPCGTAIESRTHIVGESEICKEERDALEGGVRKLDVGDMEEFGRPESSEKTIVILGDR